jgi:hypothetical protein
VSHSVERQKVVFTNLEIKFKTNWYSVGDLKYFLMWTSEANVINIYRLFEYIKIEYVWIIPSFIIFT